ncbi:MAG: hypothetical protein WKF47_12395 [Geodermatophilaceae bacterium]
MTSRDPRVVRGGYLILELTGWYVLVPLAFASLLTGLVQSLGTSWGLFRHYWVLFKLLMNLFATGVLLLYMQTLSFQSGLAADATASGAELSVLRRSPTAVIHASGAMLLLLVAVTLSVYKPRAMTGTGNANSGPERRGRILRARNRDPRCRSCSRRKRASLQFPQSLQEWYPWGV